jgi:hypothetical protein
MQEDNVYVNDGTFVPGVPLEPPEQTVERKKEQARALEAKTIIEDIIAHFDQRIAFRSDLDAIKPDLVKTPAMHQKVCEVNSMLKLALAEEKSLLEELLEVHDKN